MKEKFSILLNTNESKSRAKGLIDSVPNECRYLLTFDKEARTLDQNAAQWPILNAFADQLLWPVDGEMVKMDAEEWKDVLTAAFYQETVRLAKGLYGGVVMLGKRTRKFKRNEFAEWLSFLNAIAADRGVKIPMPKNRSAIYSKD